jgi:hypothetical protein
VVDPLVEYFSRPAALWILAFILMYKLGDTYGQRHDHAVLSGHRVFKTQVGAWSRCSALGTVAGTIAGGIIHDSIGHPSQSLGFRHDAGIEHGGLCPAGRHGPQHCRHCRRSSLSKM